LLDFLPEGNDCDFGCTFFDIVRIAAMIAGMCCGSEEVVLVACGELAVYVPVDIDQLDQTPRKF
jgi:hypothetical protein